MWTHMHFYILTYEENQEQCLSMVFNLDLAGFLLICRCAYYLNIAALTVIIITIGGGGFQAISITKTSVRIKQFSFPP